MTHSSIATTSMTSTSEKKGFSPRSISEDSQRHLLFKLTPEVRNLIWRELFLKPAELVISIDRSHGYHISSIESVQYDWSCDAGTSCGELISRRTTYATQEQQNEFPPSELRNYALLKSSTNQTQSRIHQRRDGVVQVFHNTVVKFSPFEATCALRSCRQVWQECLAVLYGENTFVFDNMYDLGRRRSLLSTDRQFHSPRYNIKESIPALSSALNNLFYPKKSCVNYNRLLSCRITEAQFLREDPLLRFFGEIGLHNAAYIQRIRIKGSLKTEINQIPNARIERPGPLNLARTLPVYVCTLYNSCPQLRSLAINNGYKNLNTLQLRDLRWTWRLSATENEESEETINDEEKVDELIGKVVGWLPSLRQLQLGDQSLAWKESFADDIWGKAWRWERFVQDRAKEGRSQ